MIINRSGAGELFPLWTGLHEWIGRTNSNWDNHTSMKLMLYISAERDDWNDISSSNTFYYILIWKLTPKMIKVVKGVPMYHYITDIFCLCYEDNSLLDWAFLIAAVIQSIWGNRFAIKPWHMAKGHAISTPRCIFKWCDGNGLWLSSVKLLVALTSKTHW